MAHSANLESGPARIDVGTPGPVFEQLPLSSMRGLEKLCCAFESAWQAGQTPRLEDYLSTASVASHDVLLAELLRLEVEYRLDDGQHPTQEEYLTRFPHARALITQTFTSFTMASRPSAIAGQKPLLVVKRQSSTTQEVLPNIPGFEVLDELGRGGRGVVYLAEDTRLRRLVAVKMILDGKYASAADLHRFLCEGELIARLQHPNIVQIYEVGQHEGRPYFALEYVPGGNLAQKIAGKPLPVRTAATLAERLARAMHYSHQLGIIHRDLKPANILLNLEWEPKIADFGLAKQLQAAEELTHSGIIMGTPSYMAPEQARGKRGAVGPQTDVFSLGAILYEMLCGVPPVVAAPLPEQLVQVVEGEPIPLTQRQPNLPRDLAVICQRCLEKEPEKRFATAAELADDLRRFLNDEPILSKPTSEWERMRKWVRRRPAVAGLMLGIAIVAVLGLAGILWQWQEALAARDTAAHRQKEEEATFWKACEVIDQVFQLVNEDPAFQGEDTGQRERRLRLLQKMLPYYRQFQQRYSADPHFRRTLAENLHKLARIEEKLEDREQALEHYKMAKDLLEGYPWHDRKHQFLMAKTLLNFANLLHADFLRCSEAESYYRQAKVILEKLVQEDPTLENRRGLGVVLYHYANLIKYIPARQGEAEGCFREAKSIFVKLTSDFPNEVNCRQDLAETLLNLGLLIQKDRKGWAEAEQCYRQSRTILENIGRDQPTGPIHPRDPAPSSRRSLAHGWLSMGNLCLEYGNRLAECERCYGEAISVLEKVVVDYPNDRFCRSDLAGVLMNLGNQLRTRVGRQAEAEACYQKAKTLLVWLSEHPSNTIISPYHLSAVLLNLGLLAELDPNRLAEAENYYREAVKVLDPLPQGYPCFGDCRDNLIVALLNLGNLIRYDPKRADEAMTQYQKVKTLMETLVKDNPHQSEYALILGYTCCTLGNLRRDRGQTDAALVEYDQSLAALKPVMEGCPHNNMLRVQARNTHANRAYTWMKLHQYSEALKEWERARVFNDVPYSELQRRVHRACSLVCAGDHLQAIAETEAVLTDERANREVFYHGANVYSMATTIPTDPAVKERYAGRAVELLNRAYKKGLFEDPNWFKKFKDDPCWDLLRNRDDFKQVERVLAENDGKRPLHEQPAPGVKR